MASSLGGFSNRDFGSTDLELCSELFCRAGRECVIGESHKAKCVCIAKCPDHFSPVCGTNNQSYDNHCQLHREACLTESHIGVLHKGYCMKKKKILPLHSTKKQPKKKQHHKQRDKPVVCLQHERDILHHRVVNFFHHHRRDQSWFREGMSTREARWGHFITCDTSRDNFLDANEFLECVKDNVTLPGRPRKNAELVRALCIDAIIDAGDGNSDWRLDFEEFSTVMEPAFKLPKKVCSLESKHYDDGTETRVDCNECICACGNWVCTSSTCDSDEDDTPLLDNDEDLDKKNPSLLSPEEWKRLLQKLEKKTH